MERNCFQLFYFLAPWCAESNYVKRIYENVADVFEDRIFFSSINCWQPAGECRIQYSNVPTWPTLMAYRSTGFGLQYNGLPNEAALVNFVNSLMYPMKRITSMDDLLRMTTSHGVRFSHLLLCTAKLTNCLLFLHHLERYISILRYETQPN